MSEHFNPTTFGKVLRIKHGYPFLGEYFADEGEFIILTPGNFYDVGGFKRVLGKEKYYLGTFPGEYICSAGDLVVAMTQQAEGLLGSTAIIPESGVYLHNQRIGLIMHDEKKADKMFLYYLFMTSGVRKQIRATASGSKVKHTSPERIYDVKVWIPDVPEQKGIADVLDKIERKINLNHAINVELEKAVKKLYDYWFVQFDFPNAAGEPYRASGGEMIWSEQLKRKIPQGWRVDKLESKLNMIRGVEPGSKAYFEAETDCGSIPFIRVSDMGSKPALNISEKAANGTRCKPTDVLVSFDGSIGKVAIAMEGAYSSGIRKITPKDDDYSDALIYFIFKSDEVQLTIDKNANKGSILSHAASSIEYLQFPYSKTVVKCFVELIEPMYQRIVSNLQQNKELSALRDFLLPLLMNGQVRVCR